jgi:hypothetical protein
MRKAAGPHRQEGAVIITVALLMLFLLGFMGFALDFGRMFVVKSELQTAMDSCALAAAQELDLQPSIGGGPSAIDRAINAGRTAGNLNAVNFQSGTWSGKGQLENAEITFKDADYATTTDPTIAHYAQCQHVQPGVQMYFMQAMGAVFSNTTDFPNARSLGAIAVATRAHGQTTCPLPVTLKPKETCGGPCPGPDYGFVPGEWITVISAQGAVPGGYIGWANLDGSTNANELRDELNGGNCGVAVNTELGAPGTKAAVSEEWNYRFGVYKKLPDFDTDPSYMRPDFSGFAYNSTSWPSQSNAWSDFVQKRASYAKCASDIDSCRSSTGVTVKNPFKDLADSGSGPSSHGAWGTNRRVVTVPVTDGGNKVIDFACMLLLAPLPIPMSDTKLEYLGNASLETSPCSFSGMPGGVAGPLVPALVQ